MALPILIVLAFIVFLILHSWDDKKKEHSKKQMHRSLFVGSAKYYDYESDYQIKDSDKAIIVKVLSGKAPKEILLSGVEARDANFKAGETYLIECIEQPKRGHYKARSFHYRIIKKLNARSEIDSKLNELGKPVFIDIFNDIK